MLKKLLRFLLPRKVREWLIIIIPKFHKVNTYILKNPTIFYLTKINNNFIIKKLQREDIEVIRVAESHRNPKKFANKIIPRLNSPDWIGLAVFDKSNGEIAYLAWIIVKSIPYIEEFDIYLKANQFLLKDGYCVPHYRHQGLHTRMEQERINYCVQNGATEIFIQIHNVNKKGIKSVLGNGYTLYKQNLIIHWPIFNVYRSLKGFLKNPFKKIIK